MRQVDFCGADAMAVINRMPSGAPAEPERDLVAERDDIIEKVYDIVQDLVPNDGSGMPPEIEHKVERIRRDLSELLGIEPQD